MGIDTGIFILLIAGSQGGSCLVTSIYSKKKEIRSSTGRSDGNRSEIYPEEKINKRCCEEQKKETRSIGVISIQSRRLMFLFFWSLF